MAENSDGVIVLSINIDSSEVSSDMQKVISEISKQVQAEAKNLKAIESVNQAKAKTAELQSKANKEVWNEIAAEEKALAAEEKKKQAKIITAQEQSKLVQEEEKGEQAITQSQIAQEKLEQATLNTAKANNNLLISDEKVTQAVNNTAISHEKVGQAITNSEIKQERLTQAINNSIISSERLFDIDGALEQSAEMREQAQQRIADGISEVERRQGEVAHSVAETVSNSDNMTMAQQELAQAVNQTAISEERTKQAVIDSYIKQEQLKQAINDTAISEEKVAQAKQQTAKSTNEASISQQKLLQEVQKTSQAEQKTSQEKAKTSQKNKEYADKLLLDEEKLKQAKEKTKQSVEKTKQSVEKTTQAVEKTKQAVEKTKQAILRTNNAQKSFGEITDSVTAKIKKMASTLGIYLSVRQLLNFSNQASELAAQTEANLKRLPMLYGEAAQSVYDFANANANAFGMSKTAAYDAAADYGNIFTTFASGADSAKLTNKMLQATAVIASQTGRTYEDVFEKIRSGLYGNTRAIDDLGLSVRQASLETTKAYKQITGGTKSWNDLTDAELQNARALGILEQASEKYGNTVMQSASLTRSQFSAAWKDFKATWGQVINIILIPILKVATQVLNTITELLKRIFNLSDKMGAIFSNVTSIKGGVDDTTDSIKDMNKELKKTLASFDQVSILKSNDSGSDSTGATASGGGVSLDGGDEVTTTGSQLSSKLAVIVQNIIGAALVALGVFMMFSGHLLLGLGMVALGAVQVWKSIDELADTIPEDMKSKVEGTLEVVGKVAAIVGIVLLFVPGCFAIGLGLLSLGAVALADSLELSGEDVKEMLGDFCEEHWEKIKTLSFAMVIAGIIMLFIPGMFTYALVLMGLGAAAVLGGSELSGEDVKAELEKFCKNHWEQIKIISAAMVIAGIVMLFTPMFKSGLVLIGLGAATAIGASKLAGEDMISELKEFITNHWEAIKKLAVVVSIVGMVLLFTGNFGAGLALLSLGIATAIGGEKLSGKSMITELKQFIENHWEAIKKLSKVMVAIGAVLVFTGNFLYGVALIGLGIASIMKVEKLSFKDALSAIMEPIKTFFSKMKKYGHLLVVLGLSLMLTGVGFSIGLKVAAVGAGLVFGSMIASGKSLSDAIVSMLDQVVGILRTISFAAGAIGVILCSTGHPVLGASLIVSGFGTLFSTVNLNAEKQTIADSVSTMLEDAKTAAETAVNEINEELEKIGDIDDDEFEDIEFEVSTKVGTKVGNDYKGYNNNGATSGTSATSAQSISFAVPALAKGTVLPGGNPYLAIVNDNPKGQPNIEGPASLVKEMVDKSLDERGITNGYAGQQVIREEHYHLNQTELMDIVYKLAKGGERKVGTSLIKGGI